MIEDKNELQDKIREMEKEAEAANKKRKWIVIAALSAIIFLFYYFDNKPDNLGDILTRVLISVFGAGIHMGIYEAIFDWLYSERRHDQNKIDFLKKKLDEDNTP